MINHCLLKFKQDYGFHITVQVLV